MKSIRTLLLTAIGMFCGCTRSDSGDLLAQYIPEISSKVTVLESRGRDWGMDFDLIWKVESPDTKHLLSQLKEFTPRTNELGLISENYPKWWPSVKKRGSMPAYFWNQGDRYKVIWHDASNRVLYVQWFNT